MTIEPHLRTLLGYDGAYNDPKIADWQTHIYGEDLPKMLGRQGEFQEIADLAAPRQRQGDVDGRRFRHQAHEQVGVARAGKDLSKLSSRSNTATAIE